MCCIFACCFRKVLPPQVFNTLSSPFLWSTVCVPVLMAWTHPSPDYWSTFSQRVCRWTFACSPSPTLSSAGPCCCYTAGVCGCECSQIETTWLSPALRLECFARQVRTTLPPCRSYYFISSRIVTSCTSGAVRRMMLTLLKS